MTTRLRREPPAFRVLEVRRTLDRSPHLRRVTLGGEALDGLDPGLPAASVRLLVPTPGDDGLVVPTWTGNEFLRPDGTRPVIRTYTPLHVDIRERTIDLDVVLHDGGAVSDWARSARPGDPAAISGTGRGYTIDPHVRAYVLAGDETALPAISQLLGALPAPAEATVVVEVASPDARVELPERPGTSVHWHDLAQGAPPGDALVAAVRALELDPEGRIWVAGEAAAVQRVRRHLFEERGIPRSQAHVRGYWKHGRAGGDEPGD